MLQKDEGNKLIAEFMGRCGKVNKHLYWVNIPSVKWVTVEQMQFHTSWDWIIPVVEKCRERQIFNSNRLINQITDSLVTLDIDAVWIACLEFIQFYNQNK